MGEKRIYDNPWIGVTEYDVLNPSGGKGIYGKVFFKNLAIGAVPLDGDGYTWLVGQYRFPLDRYSWEIPEGGGDVRERHADSQPRPCPARAPGGGTVAAWPRLTSPTSRRCASASSSAGTYRRA